MKRIVQLIALVLGLLAMLSTFTGCSDDWFDFELDLSGWGGGFGGPFPSPGYAVLDLDSAVVLRADSTVIWASIPLATDTTLQIFAYSLLAYEINDTTGQQTGVYVNLYVPSTEKLEFKKNNYKPFTRHFVFTNLKPKTRYTVYPGGSFNSLSGVEGFFGGKPIDLKTD